MGGFGAFGKMPALGDFLRLGLAQDFTDAWDAWLQAQLVAARDSLGKRWRDLYMSAPIWSFTLAPGLAGATGVLGVMMPSVDRVGRMYPMTFAAKIPAGTATILHRHLAAAQVFRALEELALRALDDGASPAGIVEALAGIVPPPAPPRPALLASPTRVVLVAGPEGPAAALAGCCKQFAGNGLGSSVWSSRTLAGSRLLVVDGLPGGAEAVGLFDSGSPIWETAPPDAS